MQRRVLALPQGYPSRERNALCFDPLTDLLYDAVENSFIEQYGGVLLLVDHARTIGKVDGKAKSVFVILQLRDALKRRERLLNNGDQIELLNHAVSKH